MSLLLNLISFVFGHRAQDTGIVILSEVGLDPGLDHMRYVIHTDSLMMVEQGGVHS